MPGRKSHEPGSTAIPDVPIEKCPENCTPVKPLVEIYMKQLTKKIQARLNLKTNIKSGFHIRIDHFIPFEIFSFIYRAILEAKDAGVTCKVLKDRKTTLTIGYEIKYTNPTSLKTHFSTLSGKPFSTSKKINSNTVKLKANPVDPVMISFDVKKNKVKLMGKYLILNQFMEPVCL